MTVCDHCERPLPGGCLHLAGHHKECLVGPRRDPAWVVGMALWADLTDRSGVKHELQACADNIQVEIVETLGKIAIKAVNKLAKPPAGGAQPTPETE